MIRFAESIEAIAPRCEASPFGCQVLSAANAYGFARPFAQFWTDAGAAYGLLDGVMRISGRVEDAEEARAFLKAVGAKIAVISTSTAEREETPSPTVLSALDGLGAKVYVTQDAALCVTVTSDGHGALNAVLR